MANRVPLLSFPRPLLSPFYRSCERPLRRPSPFALLPPQHPVPPLRASARPFSPFCSFVQKNSPPSRSPPPPFSSARQRAPLFTFLFSLFTGHGQQGVPLLSLGDAASSRVLPPGFEKKRRGSANHQTTKLPNHQTNRRRKKARALARAFFAPLRAFLTPSSAPR